MPNDGLAHVPGGTFFFSVTTERNMPIFRRIMSDIGPLSGCEFILFTFLLLPDWVVFANSTEFFSLRRQVSQAFAR